MKNKMFALLAFVLLVSAVSLAQYGAPQDNPKAATSGKQKAVKPKTVTGCLQKGDQPGKPTITGKDGKSWDLRSDTIKLDEHIGHTVTVTGSATHETKAEEKKEGEVQKAAGKEEYGDLLVTDLKMVSDTCAK